MQITFDPHDVQDRDTVIQVLDAIYSGQSVTPKVTTSTAVTDIMADAPTATVTVTADTPVAAVADEVNALEQAAVESVEQREETQKAEWTGIQSETDVHGMVWNDAIHSTPATKNSDGSWRAKRGKKDEYEAAIAAHKAGAVIAAGETMTPAPVPAAMPGMPVAPAAPVPQTPAAPIEFDKMALRFTGMIEQGEINDFETVYNDCGIVYAELETNQTMIANLWRYMDAIDAGSDHAGAITAVRNAG